MKSQNKIPNVLAEELGDYLPPRTDEKKREYLREGKLIHFELSNKEPVTDEAKAEDKRHRTLQAAWLNELATKPARMISVPIKINNAIIEGPLNLQYATFEYELSITNSEFSGDVDLSFATFNRSATFDGSQFYKLAKFRAAHAKGDFEIISAYFSDCDKLDELHEDDVFRADFQDLQVDYVFRADGARFGCVNFKRIEFAKSALFRPAVPLEDLGAQEGDPLPVCFKGEVNFSEAHIRGSAFFEGADFQKITTFDNIRIDSVANFSCYTNKNYVIPTRFGGETRFVGSQIAGNADFRGTLFEEDVRFDRSRIVGNLFFQAYPLDEKIKFERLRPIEKNHFFIEPLHCKFIPVRFLKLAHFFSVTVNGSVVCNGAQFQGDANFELIHVDGHALFRPAFKNNVYSPVFFGQTARFFHAHIEGNTEFDGALFAGNAVFELAETSNILFRPYEREDKGLIHVYFHGKASFLGMYVKGEAQFSGSYFNDDASFESMHVHGNGVFDSFIHDIEINPSNYKKCNPVHFERLANFNNAHFKHDVYFDDGEFGQKADFTRTITEGAASFQRAKFYKDVSLSNASFIAALFREEAQNHNLIGNKDKAQEIVPVEAEQQQQPASNVSLLSRILRGLWKNTLDVLRLARSLSSNIKQRRAESSKKPEPQFHGKIDLRGFTYERIEINLDELLDDKIEPYDRQPYTQLEKVYRAISDDDSVDKVYVKLRRCERKRIKERFGSNLKVLSFWKAMRSGPYWFLDYLHWRLTGYGTLPVKLLLISCLFVGIGTFMFAQQGAVKYKDKIDELLKRTPDNLDYYEAFSVSLNQFIPIVEIPSGSKWKPADKLIPYINPVPYIGSHITYASYGTVHRIAGAVLVPLGLASLTLLLYRRGRAG